MRLFPWKPSLSGAAGTAAFDQLRARLEVEVVRPAVIGITSSTAGDGKDIAARGLAYSLATAGYSTLLVYTSLTSLGSSKPPPGLTLEDIGRQVAPDPGTGNPAVLTLSDLLLQKTTSQRNLRSALEMLRSKFEYVVLDVEQGVSTSFATAIVGAADAVLVTVKTGRRAQAGDARLSADLERVGVRFLGVLALDGSIIRDDPTVIAAAPTNGELRRKPPHVNGELQGREAVDALWPN